MLYNVRIYDNAKDVGSGYSGILFENVTTDGVIDIVRFALEYGKAVSAVAVELPVCDDKDASDVTEEPLICAGVDACDI